MLPLNNLRDNILYQHYLSLVREITLCLQYICSLQLEKFRTRSTLVYTNDLAIDSDEWFKYLANGRFGGARGSRTLDLLLAKQALSQLSYGPNSLTWFTNFRWRNQLTAWWAMVDSNHRPQSYQDCALTT
jgi:hypothetical protein